jgi:hypothetical protein
LMIKMATVATGGEQTELDPYNQQCCTHWHAVRNRC